MDAKLGCEADVEGLERAVAVYMFVLARQAPACAKEGGL